ncbi:hypothetical protein FHX74_001787 [Friedmanniella endophytica]|uniref:Uncharacterized protein n=1 Tax=Microlunatus kandeliicorticis TaxID=1759536 RepID=A0A7W3IS09_9ACTN|nr:hypothetical protein [Microlunatus kandeliicorticis]MBA8794182.1 hypothetical protein [Microlunatus kandeliicorticis]
MRTDGDRFDDDLFGPGAGAARRRRRAAAAQAAASVGGLASLSAVLLGIPELTSQAHAVRVGAALDR